MWIVHADACCRMKQKQKQKPEALCVETAFCGGGHDDRQSQVVVLKQ